MSTDAVNNRKKLNVLFCTPVYALNAGDALNERQLIESLSKKVNAIYILNLFDISLLHPAYRKKLTLKSTKPNVKLINIPLFPVVPERFVVLYTTRLLFYNLLLLCLGGLMKKLKVINAIYVRNPEYAFAFASFKKIIGHFSFKFAGFHTQESLASMRFRSQRWLYLNIFERINYRVLNSADLVLTHSSFYEQELRSKYSIPKEKKILVVPSGINIEKIEKIRRDNPNTRCSVNQTSRVRIGVVGSANWWDGSDILLEAMPQVLRLYPNVTLSFVFGTGDAHLIECLKSRAKALGVTISVKGPLSHEEALAEMCQLFALVLPRRRTLSAEITIPIKVAEALALGVPIIITKHKVFKGVFKDHEDLIFIEPEPIDVSQKVVMLLSEPELANRLSKNGVKIANRFSYDKVSEKFADALYSMQTSEKK